MRRLTQKQLDNLKLGRIKGIKRPNLKGKHKPAWLKNKLSILSKGKHYSPKTEWKKGYTPEGSILFDKGHVPWSKGKKNLKITGAKHPRWKGGRILHQNKYWLIYSPNHPDVDNRGYVREHRLVMEKKLGRRLRGNELVHHINHDTKDNRQDNLELVSRSNHIKIHYKEILEARWKV